MEKKFRLLIKLILVIVLTVLFIWLIDTDKNVLQSEQPEGELIQASDVWILVRELGKAGAEIDADSMEAIYFLTEQEEYLSYYNYMKILDYLLGETSQAYEKEKITYKNKYREEFWVLKKDWYSCYKVLLGYYGLEKSIQKETVEILCGSQQLAGENKVEEGYLIGKDTRIYECVSRAFVNLKFISVKAYVRENRLLTLLEILPDKMLLENAWIMEEEGEQVQFFYEGYELLGSYKREAADPCPLREQVGTITCQEGAICNVSVKEERISGKLLGISEEQLEIEGYGSLEINKVYVGYKLYEELAQAKLSDLSIGYDFADFVLENGKVCAFLITRKEKMETIRVALKDSNFSSIYHDKITLVSQDSMTIYYGAYDERRQERIAAGQEITIEAGDEYLSGDRIEIVPDVNTGKIQVLTITRSQGAPSYRGSLEIAETREGLVLINEVLLEEYLYSVVPSEMPASYPIEALKAQAVCARTYGYRYLNQPGYAALGAHVDDSVGYQVYNNIAENVNSTKAVKETAGMLLLYEREPVSAYYYSTSCGAGADAGVWNADQREQLPYLNAVYIARTQQGEQDQQGDGAFAARLAIEENFRDYIMRVDENAYEKEEPWFRWKYQVEELDVSLLSQRLNERFRAAPGKILTWIGENKELDHSEFFESKAPEEFKKVYEMRCLKRKEGGVMDELLIETDQGIYKVVSEYNIRYILNQGGDVVRQDGSSYTSSSLLPSAYLIIDIVKSDKNVVGYSIIGGGYGHGVGMSQNGARAMGMENADCESILSFYFKGCRLDKIY